ncbi:MAG: U32 family peptidase [Bacilli bacterium]|nr:U32 family peptidase [Bacilli bacterium]
MGKIELLAPAGNMDALVAAVKNGADAVYVGGKKFGARNFAANFDYDEMIEAIKYCHLYGVKIYVTVNTIVYENEIKEVLNYIEFLHTNNVDALIMQDIGLISLVRKKYPNMEIHASTQVHNHNDEGLSLLKKMGVKRAVLARELSLSEIKNLKTDIEKEVFIHGALCISYSGCCLFSAMHGRRSGNRGECVGSCRLPYRLYENGKEVKTEGEYLLSTKSLCTLKDIDKIIESGVTSLKIEGRMKSKEYVGYITKLYREKIDSYYLKKEFKVSDEEIENIKKLYNRELTQGYIFDNYGKNLMNIKTSNHIGIILGSVLEISKNKIKIKLEKDLNQEDGIRFDNDLGLIVNRLYDEKGLLVSSVKKGNIAYIDNKIGLKNAKIVRKTQDIELIREINKYKERKVKIAIKLEAKIGERLKVTFIDNKNEITEYGSIITSAINAPTSFERIKEQIEKLGTSPFIASKTTIEMDENIFVPIKELNEIRRSLSHDLEEKRKYFVPHEVIINEIKEKEIQDDNNNPLEISIFVRNEEQLKTCINNKVDYIFTSDYSLYKKYKNKNIYYRTRRVSDNKANYENENLLVTELGALEKYCNNNNIITDYFLNVVNKSSITFFKEKNAKYVTLSPEVNIDIIKLLGNIKNISLMIYGRVELMVSKYCPMNMIIENDNKKCDLCTKNVYALKDKDDNIYPIVNEIHLTHILDSQNLDLLDNLPDYLDFGIRNFRLDLYDEKENEIENLIKVIRYSYEHRNNK